MSIHCLKKNAMRLRAFYFRRKSKNIYLRFIMSDLPPLPPLLKESNNDDINTTKDIKTDENKNQWITNVTMQPLITSLPPQTNPTPNRMYCKYITNLVVNVCTYSMHSKIYN